MNKHQKANSKLNIMNQKEDTENKLIKRKTPTKKLRLPHGNLRVDILRDNDDRGDDDETVKSKPRANTRPDTLDSSDYCYEDEQSTVYSPLPSPKGNRTSTQLQAVNVHREDLDKSSIASSSVMDYSLTYGESISVTPRYLNSDCDSLKDENSLNSCKHKRVMESNDHNNFLKQYYFERREDDIGNSGAPNNVSNHKPESRAEYIQELYRRVIASNHGSAQANNNYVPSLDIMNRHENHYAKSKRKENTDQSQSGYYNGCIPVWVIESSPLIKMVIVLSTALLIGSLALIVIAFSVSARSLGTDTSQQSSFIDNTLAPSPTIVIAFEPSIIRPSTSIPTNEPSIETIADVQNPGSGQLPVPNSLPSLHPSPQPSLLPTIQSSTKPSTISQANIGEFYITSRNRQRSVVFPLLSNLSQESNGWMIHLGNWNGHSNMNNRCRDDLYNRVSQTYKNSSVPVFFVPGDNEWNDCDDYPASVGRWRDTFVNFEMNWSPLPFQVYRQKRRIENFCFVQKKVLYFGLNMVSGVVDNTNKNAWSRRLDDNYKWVRNQVQRFVNDIKVVVIFGNSGNIEANNDFFMNVETMIKQWKSENKTLPVFYIKENDNESVIHKDYMGQSDFVLINVQSGVWPPAKVHIDTSLNHFSFNDEEWM